MIDMEHTNPPAALVAETLKEAIGAAGLSQREVAESTCIPLTTLNRHLNNGDLAWEEIRSTLHAARSSAA